MLRYFVSTQGPIVMRCARMYMDSTKAAQALHDRKKSPLHKMMAKMFPWFYLARMQRHLDEYSHALRIQEVLEQQILQTTQLILRDDATVGDFVMTACKVQLALAGLQGAHLDGATQNINRARQALVGEGGF